MSYARAHRADLHTGCGRGIMMTYHKSKLHFFVTENSHIFLSNPSDIPF